MGGSIRLEWVAALNRNTHGDFEKLILIDYLLEKEFIFIQFFFQYKVTK